VRAAIASGLSSESSGGSVDIGKARSTISCSVLTCVESVEMVDSVADNRVVKAIYIGCFIHSKSFAMMVGTDARLAGSELIKRCDVGKRGSR
jgi:hypothetical protein